MLVFSLGKWGKYLPIKSKFYGQYLKREFIICYVLETPEQFIRSLFIIEDFVYQ